MNLPSGILQPSHICTVTPGVRSVGMSAGMSMSCVSAPGIVPSACWDGRRTPTCHFLSDQRCLPPLPGRQDGFQQHNCPAAEPPQGAQRQRTLTFLALGIGCSSNDISRALCRREGGSFPACKLQLVKKPSTVGKQSRKLQLAPRHVWSADLFLSGGQKRARLLLSKGQ